MELDHSILERALQNPSVTVLNGLFGKGHKLCSRCWSECLADPCDFNVIRCLINHDNTFINCLTGKKNHNVLLSASGSFTFRKSTILMKFFKREEIEFLLAHGADANALDQNGRNVLFHAIEKAAAAEGQDRFGILTTLIEAGANPMIQDENGHSLLYWTVVYVENYDAEVLQFLIDVGVNPLVETHMNQSVLSASIKMYYHKREVGALQLKMVEKRLEAVKYLFGLPHFDNGQYQLNDTQGQTLLFSELTSEPYAIADYNILADVFDFFFKPYFVNGNVVVVDYLLQIPGPYSCSQYRHEHVTLTDSNKYTLGVVGSFLSKLPAFNIARYFLEKLSSINVSLSDPAGSFSPLVISLMQSKPDKDGIKYVVASTTIGENQVPTPANVEKEKLNETFELVKCFVKGEAYVGQRLMSKQYSNDDLAQLAEDILLPDAIYVLISRCCRRANSVRESKISMLSLRHLLPFMAAPPLALALFVCDKYHHFSSNIKLIQHLLPILFEFGPVPPGTKLLAQLRQYFHKLVNCVGSWGRLRHHLYPLYQVFDDMHRSPPSLLELCRSKIRMTVAAQMPTGGQGRNLPDQIYSFAASAPPPLRTYLQMWPEEPPNVVVCDNTMIARLATMRSSN